MEKGGGGKRQLKFCSGFWAEIDPSSSFGPVSISAKSYNNNIRDEKYIFY